MDGISYNLNLAERKAARAAILQSEINALRQIAGTLPDDSEAARFRADAERKAIELESAQHDEAMYRERAAMCNPQPAFIPPTANDSTSDAARQAEIDLENEANGYYSEPATFKGDPLPDPAKIAARQIVSRDLARPKYAELQPSLMPDVPDSSGQVSLF